ncbi:MAG: sulfatase [Actinomycetota bacterium]
MKSQPHIRWLIRSLCAAAGILVLTIAAAPSASLILAQGETDPPPNILLILTDDQREGLEVMPATRNLFGAQGRTFSNAFATTPLCCPSRASILTGSYTHNHGVRSNGLEDWKALDHSTTIERYLQDAGYRTAMYGKFLNNWPVRRDPPYFDSWAVIPKVFGRRAYYDSEWNVNGRVKRVSTYATQFIESKGLRFLQTSESNDSQPWFLFLSTTAPHAEFTPEPIYENATVPKWNGNPAVSESDRSDKPAYVRAFDETYKEGAAARRGQLRTLMSVDDLVEAVMGELDRLGEENTLAIFLSDNGYFWSEHKLPAKGAPYLQSVRVPMLLRWEGQIEANSVDERLVANIDVAPTILSAAGIPFGGDGGNLLDNSWSRDRLLLEYWIDPYSPTIPRWASTVERSAQYIEYYNGDGDVIFREFYDLGADPWQLQNLRTPPDPSWADRLREDRRCAGASCP